MKDMKRQIQEKVLEEIMNLMEGEESEQLKKHSPKFMKVETNDPEVAEKVMEGIEKPEMSSESPSDDDSMDTEIESSTDEDEDDEERLKQLYSKLR